MNSPAFRYIQTSFLLLIVFVSFFAGTCNSGLRKIEAEQAKKDADAIKTKAAIKKVIGIDFTEARRRFDNGLSFSPVGYRLVPEWRITFISMDSVNIYSPFKKRFLHGPLVFDHDSVFNIAWAWLKLRYVNKDSMQFQVLHVHDKVISDEKERVYMTFYSNSYIKDVLHTDTGKLWIPTHKDTLFIKAKTLAANSNHDKAFAGTSPPAISSKSPLVTVKREPVPDAVDGGQSYDAYLSPTYTINIRKAYDDFSYAFVAFVDEKGVLSFRSTSQYISPEFKKSTTDAMKGITDGYLNLYLNVTPGKTLGITHTSMLFLTVNGTKN